MNGSPVRHPKVEDAALAAFPPLILADGEVDLTYNEAKRWAFVRGALWATSVGHDESVAAARAWLAEELNGADPNEEEIRDARLALQAARKVRRG